MKIGSNLVYFYIKTQKFLKLTVSATPKGFRSTVARGTHKIRRILNNRLFYPFWFHYNRTFKSRDAFVFQNTKYKYFYHQYNVTWRNERTVEIPIVLRILCLTHGDILEVGNVLSHYFETEHDIIDKYEQGPRITTQDVTEVETLKRYDLIISISTLEHVGWDENPADGELVNDPDKILRAMEKLKTLLKPRGNIFFTVPIGYNPHLDKLLEAGRLLFDKCYFMKRVSKKDRWVEADWEDVKGITFNKSVPTANAIMIGIIENHS